VRSRRQPSCPDKLVALLDTTPPDGKPARDQHGAATVVRRWDARDRLAGIVYLDADGHPTRHEDGYPRVAYTHGVAYAHDASG
jgi:hypothetical protein